MFEDGFLELWPFRMARESVTLIGAPTPALGWSQCNSRCHWPEFVAIPTEVGFWRCRSWTICLSVKLARYPGPPNAYRRRTGPVPTVMSSLTAAPSQRPVNPRRRRQGECAPTIRLSLRLSLSETSTDVAVPDRTCHQVTWNVLPTLRVGHYPQFRPGGYVPPSALVYNETLSPGKGIREFSPFIGHLIP